MDRGSGHLNILVTVRSTEQTPMVHGQEKKTLLLIENLGRYNQ